MLFRTAFTVGSLALGLSSAHAVTIDYDGQWHNLTFNSTGAARATVTTTLPNVSVSFDLDGNVFGGLNPAPLVLSGIASPDGSVAFTPINGHATYGDVTASTSALGVLTAACANVPGQVSTVLLTGTTSPALIDLTYDITFDTGSTGANGTVLMRAIPEPTSIAALTTVLWVRRRRH